MWHEGLGMLGKGPLCNVLLGILEIPRFKHNPELSNKIMFQFVQCVTQRSHNSKRACWEGMDVGSVDGETPFLAYPVQISIPPWLVNQHQACPGRLHPYSLFGH